MDGFAASKGRSQLVPGPKFHVRKNHINVSLLSFVSIPNFLPWMLRWSRCLLYYYIYIYYFRLEICCLIHFVNGYMKWCIYLSKLLLTCHVLNTNTQVTFNFLTILFTILKIWMVTRPLNVICFTDTLFSNNLQWKFILNLTPPFFFQMLCKGTLYCACHPAGKKSPVNLLMKGPSYDVANKWQ